MALLMYGTPDRFNSSGFTSWRAWPYTAGGNLGFYTSAVWGWYNPLISPGMRPGNILPGDASPSGRFTRSVTGPTDNHLPIRVQEPTVWVPNINFDGNEFDPPYAFLVGDGGPDYDIEQLPFTPSPLTDFTWDEMESQARQWDPFAGIGMLQLAEAGYGDVTEAIYYGVGVPLSWETDTDTQEPVPDWQSDRDLLDTGIEKITLPFNPWDTDADFQFAGPSYLTDRDLLDSMVELVQYGSGVLDGWDTDAEQQRPLPDYSTDRDLLDSMVELVQYGPGVLDGWDTDADVQPQAARFPAVFDSEEERQWTNLIILPPLVTRTNFWDTDAENQIPAAPYTVEAFEHQDRANLVILPPLPPFDTDADQQKAQPPMFQFDDQERREATNFIVLPPAPWVYELMEQMKNEGVGLPAQAAGEAGQDWTYLIIVPPAVITQPWDTDAEQQQQASAWGIEREASEPAPFIVYAPGVLTGWDTDAEQQRPSPDTWNKQAEEDQDRSNLIIIPPFVGKTPFDTDADSQFSTEQRFIDRIVEMQDRSNLIILPFLPPFDTDPDSQFRHSEVSASARQEWTQDWINSVVSSVIRRAAMLLGARVTRQSALTSLALPRQVVVVGGQITSQVVVAP